MDEELVKFARLRASALWKQTLRRIRKGKKPEPVTGISMKSGKRRNRQIAELHRAQAKFRKNKMQGEGDFTGGSIIPTLLGIIGGGGLGAGGAYALTKYKNHEGKKTKKEQTKTAGSLWEQTLSRVRRGLKPKGFVTGISQKSGPTRDRQIAELNSAYRLGRIVKRK
jgi:hypothetical protein